MLIVDNITIERIKFIEILQLYVKVNKAMDVEVPQQPQGAPPLGPGTGVPFDGTMVMADDDDNVTFGGVGPVMFGDSAGSMVSYNGDGSGGSQMLDDAELYREQEGYTFIASAVKKLQQAACAPAVRLPWPVRGLPL